MVTTGDKILDRPLAEIGGKGLFLKEIEERLLDGNAQLAVHSMKDVPPEVHPDLHIGCIPQREDPRDVVITQDGRPFLELKEGARLGTSSLRRAVQLTALRPDLQVVPIRGNVGTRIEKCRRGEVDATVLARAGLNRLGLQDSAAETLSAELCLPAVGQGALAIEIRRSDSALVQLLSVLEDRATSLCAHAERGVMRAVDGDCKTPVAAFATLKEGTLYLRALLAEPDGSQLRRAEITAPSPQDPTEAAALGFSLGQRLKG